MGDKKEYQYENEELKRLREAPSNGWALAYFRQGVVFCEYTNSKAKLTFKKVKGNLLGSALLEIHLFNQTIEYRAVVKSSGRYQEAMISDELSEHESTIEEEVLLKEGFIINGNKTIKVINYLSYPEKKLRVDNYRLAIPSGKEQVNE